MYTMVKQRRPSFQCFTLACRGDRSEPVTHGAKCYKTIKKSKPELYSSLLFAMAFLSSSKDELPLPTAERHGNPHSKGLSAVFHGQPNLDRGSLPQNAIHLDGAAVPIDDFFDDVKPQS